MACPGRLTLVPLSIVVTGGTMMGKLCDLHKRPPWYGRCWAQYRPAGSLPAQTSRAVRYPPTYLGTPQA